MSASAQVLSVEAVQWRRLVRPQADGYDSSIILNWAKQLSRHPAPAAVPASHWCGVPLHRVRGEAGEISMPGDAAHGVVDEALDHPNLAAARSLLETWPEARQQISKLVDGIYVVRSIHGMESICGSWVFCTIYSSCHRPEIFVENVLHEMAHQKLRALGVGFERAVQIVLNDPLERFPSPVKPEDRPMPAIVQTMYSFTHVLDFQRRLGQVAEGVRVGLLELAETVEAHIETDRPEFVSELLEWVAEVATSP